MMLVPSLGAVSIGNQDAEQVGSCNPLAGVFSFSLVIALLFVFGVTQ